MKALFAFATLFLLTLGQFTFADPMSFQQVTENIYAGGKPNLEDLRMLRALGVKRIINLQGGNLGGNPQFDSIVLRVQPGESPEAIAAEASMVASLGMEEVSLPLPSYASRWQDTPPNLTKVLNIMQNATDKIYVHCEHGIDRTGLVVSLFRVRVLQETPKQAKQEWRALQEARPVSLMTSIAMFYYFDRVTTAMESGGN